MDGRVPGGKMNSVSDNTLPFVEASALQSRDSDTNLKQGSKSLPRYKHNGFEYSPLDSPKAKTIAVEQSRKGKLANTLSLAALMRNVKKLSHISINTNSPKAQKRSKSLGRSKSVNRKGGEITEPDPEPLKKINGGIVCFEGDKVPGLVGLKNHGNTCFMNAVIQCLSNTELLTEYFITDQYKQDLRAKNKYSKKYGTKGELTQHLSRLLKSLWTRQYSPSISSDLKAIVGKYGPQYRGYSQHDAQEFLLWLLDKIHEDLNIAQKKKFKNNRVIHGRSDDVAAQEVMANHTRCNHSYVYDLFQALYKSSLKCPTCQHKSNTFDPFLSVSLPIPQRSKKAVYVTVVYLDAHPKQVRIGLLQDPHDTVRELRHALSCDTNIPQEQLILTEIFWDGFHRTFNDSQQLSELKETDNIYAIETLPPLKAHSDENNGGNERGGNEGVGRNGGVEPSSAGYIQLVLLNTKEINVTQCRRFGGPFVIQVPREISFLEIQEEILHNMPTMLKDGFLEQGEFKDLVFFKLKVCDGTQGKNYLDHDVEHPLFMEYIERALSICVPGGGPEHVKVLIEWTLPTKESVIKDQPDQIEEHSSVKQARQLSQQAVTGTLDECFKTYTQEERLEYDNLWFCPNCRLKQQGTTKAISLWSIPDILVIHLKRFRQTTINRTKVDTLITFPLTGLDMSERMVSKQQSTNGQQQQTTVINNNNNNKAALTTTTTTTGWSPWRPNRKAPSSPGDYVYDLYGVVNHYGNMQGGHYTAYCKSPATGKWYTFDDIKVTEISEDKINSAAAYLLFYQRRTANNSTVYNPDHWLHSVAKIKFIEPQTRHSQSQEDLLDDDKDANEDTSDNETTHHNFTRNTNPYATMRQPTSNTTRKSPPRFIMDTEDPVNNALVGSPSMGSLGLVDLCSEPIRKIGHNSKENNKNDSVVKADNTKSSASSPSDGNEIEDNEVFTQQTQAPSINSSLSSNSSIATPPPLPTRRKINSTGNVIENVNIINTSNKSAESFSSSKPVVITSSFAKSQNQPAVVASTKSDAVKKKGVAVVVSDPISVSTNVKVIGLPVSLSSPNMKSGSSSEFNDELLTVLKGREKRPKNVQEDVQKLNENQAKETENPHQKPVGMENSTHVHKQRGKLSMAPRALAESFDSSSSRSPSLKQHNSSYENNGSSCNNSPHMMLKSSAGDIRNRQRQKSPLAAVPAQPSAQNRGAYNTDISGYEVANEQNSFDESSDDNSITTNTDVVLNQQKFMAGLDSNNKTIQQHINSNANSSVISSSQTRTRRQLPKTPVLIKQHQALSLDSQHHPQHYQHHRHIQQQYELERPATPSPPPNSTRLIYDDDEESSSSEGINHGGNRVRGDSPSGGINMVNGKSNIRYKPRQQQQQHYSQNQHHHEIQNDGIIHHQQTQHHQVYNEGQLSTSRSGTPPLRSKKNIGLHRPPITTVTQLNGPSSTSSSVDRTQDEHYRTVRKDNREKTPDRGELQTWDYNQTVYLQESCV